MDEVATEERGKAKRRRKVPLAYLMLFSCVIDRKGGIKGMVTDVMRA